MDRKDVIKTYFKHVPVALSEVPGMSQISSGNIVGTFFLRSELRELTTEDSLREIMAEVDRLIQEEMEFLSAMFTPVFQLKITNGNFNIVILTNDKFKVANCDQDDFREIARVFMKSVKVAPIHNPFLIVDKGDE